MRHSRQAERNLVFRIWDIDNNQYWHAPSGKYQWNTAGHAKSAWTHALAWGERRDKSWNDYEDTSRGYVMHTFELKRVAP